ncbi:MAG: WD40 repeat domain-containing protein, partial [Methanobacteriota archaeon]
MNVRLRVLVLAAALLLASTAVARPPRDVVWSPKALDRPALDLAMNETGGRFVVLSAVGATPADRTFLGYTLASGEEWSDTTPLLTSFGSGRAALSGNGRLAVFALGTSGVPNVLAFLPDEAPLSPEWQRALEGSATDVAVSHDGNGVFVVGAATTGLGARAYHLDAQGRTVQNFQGAGRFNQVAVSFDGRWAVIGGAEPSGADTAGVVHVWSTTCCGAATKVTVPQSPSGEIFAITVDDRADIIAAGTQGGLVAVYRNRLDEPSADVVEIGKFSVPGGRVTALAVNSAGTLVAVGSASGTLTLFDRAGDGLVQRWNRTLNETVRRIQMDADGSLLLVTSDRVYAFHNSSSEPLWGLSAGGASAAISRRGDSVAIAAGTEVRAFRLDADPRIVVPGATPQGDG